MRIMQLYRIESDYKSHKQRLSNIRKLNSKDKINRITSQYFYMANEIKKIKLNDHSFQEKEQLSRRQHQHTLMNKTITQHGKKIKQQYQTSPTITPLFSRVPKSLGKPGEIDMIQLENVKLKQKIQKARSTYQGIRKKSEVEHTNARTQRQSIKKTQREKILNLLKSQFKIQSKVVFPRCKTKSIQIEHPFTTLQSQGKIKIELPDSGDTIERVFM